MFPTIYSVNQIQQFDLGLCSSISPFLFLQSPKFIRPRVNNDQSRFSLGNQLSPAPSTSTSGYATTEGRRHRALQDSALSSRTPSMDISSSLVSTTTSSSRDHTLQPPQRSTPEPVNGVVLISVRPRQTADGQAINQAITKTFERIYVTKPPVAPPGSSRFLIYLSKSHSTRYASLYSCRRYVGPGLRLADINNSRILTPSYFCLMHL